MNSDSDKKMAFSPHLHPVNIKGLLDAKKKDKERLPLRRLESVSCQSPQKQANTPVKAPLNAESLQKLIKLISQSKLQKLPSCAQAEAGEHAEPMSAVSKTTDRQSLNVSLMLDKQMS